MPINLPINYYFYLFNSSIIWDKLKKNHKLSYDTANCYKNFIAALTEACPLLITKISVLFGPIFGHTYIHYRVYNINIHSSKFYFEYERKYCNMSVYLSLKD